LCGFRRNSSSSSRVAKSAIRRESSRFHACKTPSPLRRLLFKIRSRNRSIRHEDREMNTGELGTDQQAPANSHGYPPRWTPQNRPYVDSSKPANGQRPRQALLVPCRAVERQAFSPQGGGHCFLSSAAVTVLVRQLRGPHFSTCPWCRSRSSIALTAAVSPSSLPQSSTGRLEVSSVLARS